MAESPAASIGVFVGRGGDGVGAGGACVFYTDQHGWK